MYLPEAIAKNDEMKIVGDHIAAKREYWVRGSGSQSWPGKRSQTGLKCLQVGLTYQHVLRKMAVTIY